MSALNPRRLAEELQKAKLLGKSPAEVVRRLRAEADAGIVKKNEDVRPVNEGTPERASLLRKVRTATAAIASKGLNNAKAPQETVSLRIMSCHGDNTLAPCPRRENSKKFPNSHFCGACGCGDKALTQLSSYELNGKTNDYTKLHIPKVTCPLKMPGFVNYQSCAEDAKTSNDRKQFIEFSEGIESIKSKSNPT